MKATYEALSVEHNVEWLTYRTLSVPDDVKHQKPPTARYFNIRSYQPKPLWQLLNNTDVLVVKHLHDPINFFPYLFCWLKGIHCIIITQRIVRPKFTGATLLLKIVTRILSLFPNSIVATTKDSYEFFHKHHPETTYLALPIAAQQEHANNPDSQRLRLITVGKFQARKNLIALIHSVDTLKRSYPQITFTLTIVAKHFPQSSDNTYREATLKRIKEKSLGENITVLENLSREETQAEYLKANLFILPAQSEPIGYSTVEAMAAGLPVIVNSGAGSSSYVEPNFNAYILETPTPHNVTSAIEKYIDDQVLNTTKLIHHGQHSRQLVKRNHDPQLWVEHFLQYNKKQ